MFKKIIAGMLVFGMSSLFAMSLSALNSASKSELMEINGIGEVKAAAIIKARKKGKFKSFDDLTKVEGVGEQIASNAKNDVKVGQTPKKVKKTTSKKKTSSKKETTADKKSTKAKSKKRKIKSMDDKKKELKTKAKKTKTKKTKAKKEKKTKSKKKN